MSIICRLLLLSLVSIPSFAEGLYSDGVKLGLGQTREIQLEIPYQEDFRNLQTIEISRSALDESFDTEKQVNFEVMGLERKDSDEKPFVVTLRLETQTTSPSFDGVEPLGEGKGYIELILKAEDDRELKALKVPFAIEAVYEVRILNNDRPHLWDSPNPQNNPILDFRRHPETGVTLKFYNYDTTQTHVIHGAGIIPHADTRKPMAKAPEEGKPGGSYFVTIKDSERMTTGYYYCHNHEGGANKRTLRFNLEF